MNKIYIISGIRVEKGQWNTGFDSMARRDSEGKVFATDKSRKYAIRQEMLLSGENILIRKREEEGKYLSLSNIIKNELGVTVSKKNWRESIEKLFLSNIDLRLFGFILNPKGFSANAHGSFQTSFAKDIHGIYTEEIIVDITSYKTSKETNEDMTTIGKQIIIDKGYLNYTFSINPNVYKKEFLSHVDFRTFQDGKFLKNNELNFKLIDSFIQEQFEKDYTIFSEAIKTDVSNSNSCTKNGVDNLYNIVIYMKDNLSALNVNLLQSVVVENDVIDFSNTVKALLESKDKIEKVEIQIPSEIDISDIKTKLENANISVDIIDLFE